VKPHSVAAFVQEELAAGMVSNKMEAKLAR
jgi:hypothetical protein